MSIVTDLNNCALTTWEFSSHTDSQSIVIPDGCRDLIFQHNIASAPNWFISPLFNAAKSVATKKGAHMFGFRLKPGTKIDESGLLAAIKTCLPNSDRDNSLDIINSFCSREPAIEDAMTLLSTGEKSIKKIASMSGVSERTLQRYITSTTGRTPTYWSQLARARKTARALFEARHSRAEISHLYGYADQAHLCRDIKRWYGVSPSQLIDKAEVKSQLYEPAYT